MSVADLGPLESKVMEYVWDHGPASIRETINALGGTHAYTTIATVFKNLETKDLVAPCKNGHSLTYCHTKTREEFVATHMHQVLARCRNKTLTLQHFVTGLSQEEAALLREKLG